MTEDGHAAGRRRVAVTVHGRVQGVGYRWSTRLEAERLGVAGWVVNRADGSVAAELDGPTEAVERMLEWMRVGPPGAMVERVEPVEQTAVPPVDGTRFSIR